ncbi:hypothetical protein GCM10017673_36360 [Streptosporangium violaceochromogenes]|nr:hypothetical protein GCM10017673_36360 [Streptosporangium violaceochromogenes]
MSSASHAGPGIPDIPGVLDVPGVPGTLPGGRAGTRAAARRRVQRAETVSSTRPLPVTISNFAMLPSGIVVLPGRATDSS